MKVKMTADGWAFFTETEGGYVSHGEDCPCLMCHECDAQATRTQPTISHLDLRPQDTLMFSPTIDDRISEEFTGFPADELYAILAMEGRGCMTERENQFINLTQEKIQRFRPYYR